MNTKSIKANCKICKSVVVAQVDTCCPDEWANKLLPMITCNPCFDLHKRRRDTEDALYAATKSLRFDRLKNEARQDVIGAIRSHVRSYAKWFADLCKQGEYHFDEEIVQNIVEQPDKLFIILKMFRTTVRGHYANRAQLTN